MLNLSDERVVEQVNPRFLTTLEKTSTKGGMLSSQRWVYFTSAFVVAALFLPWTQNITEYGVVTVREPNSRPQLVTAVVSGRIAEWRVREGDTVRKGDTLVYLGEVKEDYMDPQLLVRLKSELEAKQKAYSSYMAKADALEDQWVALRRAGGFDVRATTLKAISDSAEASAQRISLTLAERQMARADTLARIGVKSLYEWEQRQDKFQETKSKSISATNNVGRAQADIEWKRSSYREKEAKLVSDRAAALADAASAQGEVQKLESKLSSLRIRVDNRYLLAPADGMVSRIFVPGLGQTVKEAEPLVEVVPSAGSRAVEMQVPPQDIALVHVGLTAQVAFDGWPSLPLPGWPAGSTGVFTSKVVAVSPTPAADGKFRILLVPTEPWPDELALGTGTYGVLLLKNVPLWYEIWRQFNGFPPDYYLPAGSAAKGKKS